MANKKKWIRGKIKWFDPVRGEGSLRAVDSKLSYYFNDSILRKYRGKPNPKLPQNLDVEFVPSEDMHYVEVEEIRGY